MRKLNVQVLVVKKMKKDLIFDIPSNLKDCDYYILTTNDNLKKMSNSQYELTLPNSKKIVLTEKENGLFISEDQKILKQNFAIIDLPKDYKMSEKLASAIKETRLSKYKTYVFPDDFIKKADKVLNVNDLKKSGDDYVIEIEGKEKRLVGGEVNEKYFTLEDEKGKKEKIAIVNIDDEKLSDIIDKSSETFGPADYSKFNEAILSRSKVMKQDEDEDEELDEDEDEPDW